MIVDGLAARVGRAVVRPGTEARPVDLVVTVGGWLAGSAAGEPGAGSADMGVGGTAGTGSGGAGDPGRGSADGLGGSGAVRGGRWRWAGSASCAAHVAVAATSTVATTADAFTVRCGLP